MKNKFLSEKKICKSLLDFLNLKISFQALEKDLSRLIFIDFSKTPEERKIFGNTLDGKIRITFSKDHILQALYEFKEGKLSGPDLSNWASFLYMSDLFFLDRQEQFESFSDTEEEYIEWIILQELMTPAVFGALESEQINRYLHDLNSL